MHTAKSFLSFRRHKISKELTSLPSGNNPMSSPSSSVASPKLPSELIDAIIDEVAAMPHSDKVIFDALKAWARVSRACVFRAQKHLFRTIRLVVDDSLSNSRTRKTKTVRRFHKLLLSRPHIGTCHVRMMDLSDETTDDHYTYATLQYEDTRNEDWHIIPQILAHLSRLESLSVRFSPNARLGTLTRYYTLTALYRALEQPSLRSAALSFVPECPRHVLRALARLQDVSLSCVDVAPDDPPPPGFHATSDGADADGILNGNKDEPDNPDSTVNIETLHLRATPPRIISALAKIIGDASTSSVSLSTTSPLTSLCVTPTFEVGFSHAVKDLITLAGENITTFEWAPSIHFSSTSYPITLRAMTRLETLLVTVSFRRSQTSTGGPFREILRLLKSLDDHDDPGQAPPHARSSLRTVVIFCHCLRIPEGLSKLSAEWRPLDNALFLLSGPSIPHDPTSASDPLLHQAAPVIGLQEVRVRLSTYTSTVEDRDSFVQAFPRLMPRVQSNGVMLSVTTTSDTELF